MAAVVMTLKKKCQEIDWKGSLEPHCGGPRKVGRKVSTSFSGQYEATVSIE